MPLVKEIFSYLNANCNYAVLRNYAGLPDNLVGRDIDILIEKNDFDNNRRHIVNIILKENYRIITYFKSDRMTTFVCSAINKCNVDIIQFDFFCQTSAYGLIHLDANQILKTRAFNGKIYHVTREFEFLDKYLYLKSLNQPYPEKYQALKKVMEQSALLNNILKEIIGLNSLQELEKLSSAAFRRKALLANLRKRPLTQLLSFYSFCFPI